MRGDSQVKGWTIAGMSVKLTNQGAFSRLAKLPGATEALPPNTVASFSTALL